MGASEPEEYRYYFWWGDTVGYRRKAGKSGWFSALNGSSYAFNGCATLGKTNAKLLSSGYIDSTGNLAAAHDAARKHLGAPWRMPTADEIGGLTWYCDTKWTKRNGVYGRLVKGRGAFAAKSIFLPAAGYGYGASLGEPGAFGNYWSSTPYSEDDDPDESDDAWNINFDARGFDLDDDDRWCGRSVRPVRDSAQ